MSGRMGTAEDITATVRYIYFVVAEHCSVSFYLRATSLTDLFLTMSEQVGFQCLVQGYFDKTCDCYWSQTPNFTF